MNLQYNYYLDGCPRRVNFNFQGGDSLYLEGVLYYVEFSAFFFLQGKGIGDVSISAGDKLHSTTTSEGVYVLNNVTAGEYIIQVKCRQQH